MSLSHKGKKRKPLSKVHKNTISNSKKGKHRIYENEEHTKWHME